MDSFQQEVIFGPPYISPKITQISKNKLLINTIRIYDEKLLQKLVISAILLAPVFRVSIKSKHIEVSTARSNDSTCFNVLPRPAPVVTQLKQRWRRTEKQREAVTIDQRPAQAFESCHESCHRVNLNNRPRTVVGISLILNIAKMVKKNQKYLIYNLIYNS